MPTVYWDSNSARYRNERGRFVSATHVRDLSNTSIANAYPEINSLASRVYNENISVGSWQAAMREQIKREYIRQYVLGRGGRDAMTQADWGHIGGHLNAEYHRYLDRFASNIAAGQYTEKQIQAYARMYMENCRHGFERGKLEAHKDAGYTHVKWTLGPTEHCEVCLDRAADGWLPIADNPWGGAVPPDGCLGYTKCGCHLEYKRESQ